MDSLNEAQRIAVKYYQVIRDHPETWDQSVWRNLNNEDSEDCPACPKNRCGAKLCFFGHIAEGEGGRWLSDDPGSPLASQLLAESGDDPERMHILTVNQDTYSERKIKIPYIPVEARVSRLLGFDSPDDDEVQDLYDGDNDLDDLRDKIMDYLGVDPEDGSLTNKPNWAEEDFTDSDESFRFGPFEDYDFVLFVG